MKFWLALAVLSLFLLAPFAEVTIAITEPQNKIFPSVANCKISGAAAESNEFGTPSEVTIKFNLNNPANDPYDITYEVYDFPTQTFSTPASSSVNCLGQPISWGGKITIGPRVFTTCSLTFPIILGGIGNGTVTQELLRIHTNEQNNPSNVQTISLTFQVDHFEISSETNLQARKSEIQKLSQTTNSTINNACYKGYCCGLIQAKENLKLANKFHADGENNLKTCKLTSSFSNFVKSLSYANNASSLSDNLSCNATLALLKNLDSKIKNAEATIADSQNCSIGNATFFLNEAKSRLPTIKIKMSSDSYAEAQDELDTGNEYVKKSLSSINCSVKGGTELPIPSIPNNITGSEPGKTCPALFLLLIGIALFYASKRS